MRSAILRLAADLEQRGEPFVLATVVRREAPSSAQVGDSALITAAGTFHGWLGGSCTQPTVVRQALAALSQRKARLIALMPNPEFDRRSGVTALPMTCHSGGTVDIYIEPVMPAARLVVLGASPTAQAMARIAHVLGWTVEAVDPEADRAMFPEADRVVASLEGLESRRRSRQERDRLYTVVATLGGADEQAVRAALSLEPSYIGVIASRKRFGQMREALLAGGVPPEKIEQIRSPAGLDIRAVTPEEIALSVLCEMVQLDRARQGEVSEPTVVGPTTEEDRDPVCGMTVSVDAAGYHAVMGDHTIHFCSASCRDRLMADPERYGISVDAGDSA